MCAGALNVFAFAPFGWWPVQIGTLALLFWMVLRQATIRRSVLIGWAFGFGWSAAGVHWLYISMHRYGGLPSWMAILAVALLAAVLGLFFASALGAGSWFRLRRSVSATMSMLLVFPLCWMLGEWLRGWVLTGFPWVASGYAHAGGPLAGFAPIIGVYGLGWLAALLAGSAALLPEKKLPLALAAVILAGGFGLKAVDWTEPNGEPISVRLLQGNVPQEMKFADDQIHATLALYDELIQAAPADLVATPETALPVLTHQLPPDYLPRLAAYSKQSGSHLALGVAVSDGPGRYANSVLGFSPAGDSAAYRFDKHHLVPFGEFIPAGARWFVEMMRIPLGDFTRGPNVQTPFAVKDQWVMPNICYEDLFGEEIAGQLAAAYFSGRPLATMLLNVSNIAWFGDSIALPQHLQISQMRSLETGRPMLRATNTGATAVIDPKGKVLAQLEPYSRGVLSASVQGFTGWTPYTLGGNAPVVGMSLLLLGFVWLTTRPNRKISPTEGKTR